MNLDFRIFYWTRKWDFPIYLFHFNICFQLFYFSIIEKWHYDRKIEKMVNCQQQGWSTHLYHEFNIQTHKYLKSRIHSISCIWIFVKLNPWKVYSCNINVCLMTRVLLGLFRCDSISRFCSVSGSVSQSVSWSHFLKSRVWRSNVRFIMIQIYPNMMKFMWLYTILKFKIT